MRLSISLRLVGLCLSLVFCTAAGVAPRKTKRAAAPDGNRFLFVVETSSAMLPFEHAGRQAVFDLIFSGIDNQAKPGDTLGIWNFGEDVHGGVFPMQVWDADQNLQLASLIGLFLKNQKYESQGRLERVIPKLASLIKAVKDVNILMISGTEHVWKGTPFDADLNAAFQKHAAESLAAKRPLVTALVARGGVLVNWSVVEAGEPIVLPRITIEKPPPAPVLQPGIVGARTANSNGAPPAVRSIVITSKKAEADEPSDPGVVRITVSKKEPVQTAPGDTEGTNDISSLASVRSEDLAARSKQGPASELAKAVGTNGPSALKTSPGAATTPAPARASAGVGAMAAGVLTVAAREQPGDAPLAAASPPQTLVTARSLIWAGTALALTALGLCCVAWRLFRAAPRPSYITQSFEREK